MDLGIRPFLIADSLVGVVSQRLVRKICTGCKTAYEPSEAEKAYLHDPEIGELFKGNGCKICSGTGYFERTLIYELLPIDQKLSQLIEKGDDLSVVTRTAKESGYEDIFEVTRNKVKQGVTTTEEAVRSLGHIRQE
jgi:type II secretory ATPase GspE/PulE/Tfp pilus assembly ATPase PilB-like protein